MGLEHIDLPLPHRRRIEQVHAALATLSHYELLGVPRDADRRAVAKAYLERTLEFQSTRFFVRNLGRYRQLMNDIFDQVTVAYDVLRSPSRRTDYDDATKRTRLTGVDAMVRAELESMREAHEDGRRERVAVQDVMPEIEAEPPRTKSGTRPAVTAVPSRRAAGE